MKYAWLSAALCLSGCADDELGVLYVGIDLAGRHELVLPAELGAVDADAIGASTGRVDASPAEGHMTVDVVGLPPLPVDYSYVPVFAFASDARDALEPHGDEGHTHDGLPWDLVGPALEEDEDGGMAAMLMFGDSGAPDLGALRNAGVQVVGSPELEPPTEVVLVVEGEFVFDESGGAEPGAAEPVGHNHGP